MNSYSLPPLQTITANNAAEMKELLRIGNGYPRDIVYSPDGKHFAIGSTVGIWLYDAQLQSEPRLIGEYESSEPVAFSWDGKLIASPSKAKTISIWDVATGNKVSVFNHSSEHLYVQGISFHPTETLVASGDWNSVNVWNTQTGELYLNIPDMGNVSCVAFSPDGRKLGIGNSNGQAWLWDFESRSIRQLPSLITKLGSTYLTFGRDGTLIYGFDEVVSLFDIDTWQEKKHFDIKGTLIYGLTLSTRIGVLAVAHWGGDIRLIDLESGEIQIIDSRQGIKLSLSADEKVIAYLAHDVKHTVDFYNLETGVRHSLTDFENRPDGLAISPDSSTIAYGENRDTIRVIDLSKGGNSIEFIKEDHNLRGASNTCTFDPKGNVLVFASEGLSADVYTWNIKTNEVEHWEREESYRKLNIAEAIKFSPDGNLLAVVSSRPILWDLRSSQVTLLVPNIEDGLLSDLSFSSDGKWLAIAGSFNNEGKYWHGVRLFDTHTLQLGSIFDISQLSLRSVAINQDGTLIAGGGRKVHTSVGWLLDTQTRTILFSFETATYYHAEVQHVEFSPDGTVVAYADSSGDIYIWDVKQQTRISVLSNHNGQLDKMSFSPDGKYLATLGSFDCTIRLWGVLQQ